MQSLSSSGISITHFITIPVNEIKATDISASKYKTAIEFLVEKWILNNATQIKPLINITRAEFMKLLATSNGFTPVKTTKKFFDLPSTNSLSPYVQFGVKQGWINTKNKDFRPNDIITQGEVDKLINAIKWKATADTIAISSPKSVTRGKAASDIVKAFFTK